MLEAFFMQENGSIKSGNGRRLRFGKAILAEIEITDLHFPNGIPHAVRTDEQR